jgi:hypothetical protein
MVAAYYSVLYLGMFAERRDCGGGRDGRCWGTALRKQTLLGNDTINMEATMGHVRTVESGVLRALRQDGCCKKGCFLCGQSLGYIRGLTVQANQPRVEAG